jgi:hypothetical protein
MNLDFKNLTFLQKKNTFRKDYFQINPDKYWNLLLGLFFVIILVGAGFGYYNFSKLNKALNSYTSHSKEGDNEVFDVKQKNEINDLLNYFKDREEKASSLKNQEKSLVIDPSL